MNNSFPLSTVFIGTLTENRMTVVKGWIGLQSFEDIPRGVDNSIIQMLSEGIASNSTAYLVQKDSNSKIEYVGSKTECALLEFIQRQGFDYTRVRESLRVKRMWPFSSAKKRMSSALERGNNNGKYR